MYIDKTKIEPIAGLFRCENISRNDLLAEVIQNTHSVYPHHEIYGAYCGVQIWIDCPPQKVFEYMSNIHSLSEWTYSTRNFRKKEAGELFEGRDFLEADTKIYCRVAANPEALVVDYLCAWDQGNELWMIYLNRIVDSQLVFNKPGSVVFWQNCRHPYYNQNPYPTDSPKNRAWVGDFWDFFPAGHLIELGNLKRILEYRHRNNIPIGPYFTEEDSS